MREVSQLAIAAVGMGASQVAPVNAGASGDPGSISGSGRYPRGGNDNPLQYSCLENSMDRGAWRAAVHGVRKSRTRLSLDAEEMSSVAAFLRADFDSGP